MINKITEILKISKIATFNNIEEISLLIKLKTLILYKR